MKTTDLFSSNRSSKKINESMENLFGTKLDLASFDLPKLEDARNKIRTQLSQVRANSGFNENIENEAVAQAQWMLDAINSEIIERQEFIADPQVEEGFSSEVEEFFHKVAQHGDYDMLYDAQSGKYGKDIEKAVQDMYDDVSIDTGLHADDDFEQIYDRMLDQIEADYGDSDADHEGGETDDAYALASAGFGSDEDYESIETEGAKFGSHGAEALALKVFKQNPDLSTSGRADELQDAGWTILAQEQGKKSANYYFNYDEDFPSDFVSSYGWLQDGNDPEAGEDGHQEESAPKGWEGTVKAMKKHKEIDNPYALANYMKNKGYKSHKKESTESGEDMTKLTEGEVQQASAIVTAKTMVDRVSRWIEELSGMENDTLLQLGDSIRDEMSADQAKTFISSVAPAIQQALQNLKDTRETLSTGVRMLTGEEQGAEMLGGDGGEEPSSDMSADMGGEAEPDMMNAGGEELGGDEFGAADAAVGGMETAGREQRESIDRSNSLLRVLAG